VHMVSISLHIASQLSGFDVVRGEYSGIYTRTIALKFQIAGIVTDNARNSWWHLYTLA
jgi:hypothetical protein